MFGLHYCAAGWTVLHTDAVQKVKQVSETPSKPLRNHVSLWVWSTSVLSYHSHVLTDTNLFTRELWTVIQSIFDFLSFFFINYEMLVCLKSSKYLHLFPLLRIGSENTTTNTHSLRQDFSLHFYFYLINWVLYPTNLLSFISINSPSHWLVLIWDWFCFCGLSFAFAQSQRLCLGVNWRQVCLSVPPHSTSLFITHTPNTVSQFLSARMPCSSDLGGWHSWGFSLGILIKIQLNTYVLSSCFCLQAMVC